MRRCPDCKSKYSFKDMWKMLISMEKILVCTNCGSKYHQSAIQGFSVFIFTTIFFALFDYKVLMELNGFLDSNYIVGIIRFIIGFLFIMGFTYLSQFWTKYRKCNS